METQWPRNSELKFWDFAHLQQLSEGVNHNIEEQKKKSLSSVSELGKSSDSPFKKQIKNIIFF